MLYKHKNFGQGNLGVTGSDGIPHLVKPGEEIDLDVKREGNGLVIIEGINPVKKVHSDLMKSSEKVNKKDKEDKR